MEPFNFTVGREADYTPKYDFPSELPLRNGKYNSTGRAVNIQVNQFKVTDWIKGDIQQYDVSSLQSSTHPILNLTSPSTQAGLAMRSPSSLYATHHPPIHPDTVFTPMTQH